jgi:hypothetical protein
MEVKDLYSENYINHWRKKLKKMKEDRKITHVHGLVKSIL